MGKVKYSEEMKLQTIKYVLEGVESATKVSKELGIDTNSVCRWEREYREVQGMPSDEAAQRIRRQSADEMASKIRELEKRIKEKRPSSCGERKGKDIKKVYTSLCNHKNEMRSNLRKSGAVFREKDVRSLKDQSVPVLSVNSASKQ